ncbi:MAG: LPS assembly lipoprotein LptE [Planctomycetaceae bacterium]
MKLSRRELLMTGLGTVLSGTVLSGLTGCGYMVGGGFDPQVRSVEVPIFETKSFRRGIEVQLTEAVQKQIQLRTPFRVVKGDADTRLSGRVIDLRKSVLGETLQDDPRELQVNLVVEVLWEDLRAGRILAEQQVPIGPELLALRSQADFAPEVGQSLATATQQSINQLARQIVNLMETAW